MHLRLKVTSMNPCRALEYVEIAEQNEPASVFNAFLRLKVHLVQQDSKAAAEQIKAMMSCEDFSHEILRVSWNCLKNSYKCSDCFCWASSVFCLQLPYSSLCQLFEPQLTPVIST